jgi:ribosomal protein S3
MKTLINDIKNIYLLIKRYYNDNRYKLAYGEAYKNLRLVYTNQFDTCLIYLGITDIYVYFDIDKFIINIVLSRPGEFIGESGIYYDTYKKYMEEDLGIEVQINLIEDRKFY